MGRLAGIAVHDRKRAPMRLLAAAPVTTGFGVARDFRGGPGWRQVTVLAREAWDDACRDVGAALDWTVRRANLLVEDIDLEGSTGRTLVIGGVRLEITGESRPCERMDEARPGLREALKVAWRGGVCARVAAAGEIRVGDAALWGGDGGGPAPDAG